MNFNFVIKLLLLLNLAFLSLCKEVKIPDIFEYFGLQGGDLSNVTWAHAVNSKMLLKKAFEDSNVHMIEGDVSFGKLKGDHAPNETFLIMAKPMQSVSDVTLTDWMKLFIEEIEKGKRKGAKLHFEDVNVAIAALGNGLKTIRPSIVGFPFWLHTNILKGPGAGDNEKIVHSDVFLSLCTEFFPQAILSLGWKTVPGAKDHLTYSEEMIDQMVRTIKKNNVRQPITFPVRASFDNDSISSFKKLLKEVPESSFTIWSKPSDNVNPYTLAKFSKQTGKNKAFYDLPPKHMTRFIEVRSNSSRSSINIFLICLLSPWLGSLFYYDFIGFYID